MFINLLKKIYYEKYSKKSYSISSVDLIIGRLFSNKSKGIYIDVGCNHPIKYNNTYLLHKKGWSGINIDLDKKSIHEFNKMRKNDYNVQELVGSVDNEEKDIYYYHERSAINTISKVLADKRLTKPKEIIKKKTKSLNTIIKNSPYANKKINFMSIDIENYEYEVLKNFNFEKYDIDLIVTECVDINQQKPETHTQSLEYIINTNLYKLLVHNNYKLINWVNSDLFFIKKNLDINAI
ncbi:FkbM family methyltransferase [Candidatus Pelagibacter sp.]|nr:FkbM family methyltransferase [Candidatus Pelagibacter sp.]